jgi:hypothetical protein
MDLTHTSQLLRDQPTACGIFNDDYAIVRKDVKLCTITMTLIPIDNRYMVAVTAKAVNKGLARGALIGEMIGESGKFVVDVVVQRIAHRSVSVRLVGQLEQAILALNCLIVYQIPYEKAIGKNQKVMNSLSTTRFPKQYKLKHIQHIKSIPKLKKKWLTQERTSGSAEGRVQNTIAQHK